VIPEVEWKWKNPLQFLNHEDVKLDIWIWLKRKKERVVFDVWKWVKKKEKAYRCSSAGQTRWQFLY
jgi:hypothetical protein